MGPPPTGSGRLSASTPLFVNDYQGGAYFEVFSTQVRPLAGGVSCVEPRAFPRRGGGAGTRVASSVTDSGRPLVCRV